jgi:hypothetical protein
MTHQEQHPYGTLRIRVCRTHGKRVEQKSVGWFHYPDLDSDPRNYCRDAASEHRVLDCTLVPYREFF